MVALLWDYTPNFEGGKGCSEVTTHQFTFWICTVLRREVMWIQTTTILGAASVILQLDACGQSFIQNFIEASCKNNAHTFCAFPSFAASRTWRNRELSSLRSPSSFFILQFQYICLELISFSRRSSWNAMTEKKTVYICRKVKDYKLNWTLLTKSLFSAFNSSTYPNLLSQGMRNLQSVHVITPVWSYNAMCTLG